MSRFRLSLIGCLLLALSACSGQAVTVYKLSFNVSDAQDQEQLTLAAIRVIERRLQSMGEELVDKEVLRNDGFSIKITLADADIGTILSEQLQQPLRFRIMEQAPNEQDADVVVLGHGGFNETGVDDASLYSVESQSEPDGKGTIILHFSDEGRTKLGAVFKRNKGKSIGLFVRGQLASKLLVETDTLRDTIVIRDLPSAELAQVFADDLNVGLHVTFTPAP